MAVNRDQYPLWCHEFRRPRLMDSPKKNRDNLNILKNLIFADATTSKTVLKTEDIRLDVHKNSRDPTAVTGIVQANSEATDRTVMEFIKKSSGGHKGTHQVIGQKIKFGLGDKFNVEDVAKAVKESKWAGMYFDVLLLSFVVDRQSEQACRSKEAS